jgi:hypothetical protein
MRRSTLGLRYDIDFTPLNEANNPQFSEPEQLSGGQEQPLAARRAHLFDERGQVLIRPGWGLFLRQDELRAS